MVTFKLDTAVNVGTLTAPVNVTELAVTGVTFSTTPALAQVGTGELAVTLTDTMNGWQETVKYADKSVLDFFGQAAPAPANGATVQDVMAQLTLSKLLADGKLPTGAITVS